jgi:hypothetical protein
MSLSIAHEAPLQICDHHPRVIASLLEQLTIDPLPEFDELRMDPADFTQTVAKEYRADRALVFLRNNQPVLAVIIEVQRRRDERKRRAWPLYTAALYGKLGCPTYLLVIALNPATARWAKQPISEFQPGSHFAPLVVSQEVVPKLRSLEMAQSNVPLALLSALLHASENDGEQVAYYAVRALYESSAPSERLDASIWMLRLLGGIVSAEKFRQIERLIMIEPRTRIVPTLEKWRDRYLKPAHSRGVAEGAAKALLRFIEGRGLHITGTARQRILSCTSPSQLEAWITRAATARTVAEILSAIKVPPQS